MKRQAGKVSGSKLNTNLTKHELDCCFLRAACRLSHMCKIDESNNRDLYREVFLPGVLSGLFGSYLQGNGPMVDYITTRDKMPVPLGQLEFDLQCTRGS